MSRLIKNSFAESMQASVSGNTQPKKVVQKKVEEPTKEEVKPKAPAKKKEAVAQDKPLFQIKKKKVEQKAKSSIREGDLKKGIVLPAELFKKVDMAALENDLSRRDYLVHVLGQATGCSDEQIEEWTKIVKGNRG